MQENLFLKSINSSEIHLVKELADEIWPASFASILSAEQIEYMMEMMYSKEGLNNQMATGSHFFIIQFDGKNVGYTSLIPNYKGESQLYIDKIYLSPEVQGKGLGKKVMEKIVEQALNLNLNSISLNVNRYNEAVHFYKKVGFEIEKTVDNDIGNGFFMNDYVMRKVL